MAAEFAGVSGLPRDKAACYDAVIKADVSTFILPTILSNLQNKLMLSGYTSVDPDAGLVKGTAWHVSGVAQSSSDIVITVLGQGDAPSLEALRKAVRRDVPSTVHVLVVEESGKTTAL